VPYYYQYWLDQTGLKESKQDYYALFVQDQWKIGNLTLNLGLRTEATEIFDNMGGSLVKFSYGDQIAPRLGFAYDLAGDSIHGSSAASTPSPATTSRTTSPDHRSRAALDWNNSCTPDGRDAWTYNQSCWTMAYDLPTGAGGHTLDPNLEPGYIDELTIGYDKRITDRLALGVNFIWRQQDTAIDWYDPEASGYYYITNVPQIASDAVGNKKFTEFQSIQFSAIKRLGPEGLQVVANYTYNIKAKAWSTNWRNAGAFIFTSPEAINPVVRLQRVQARPQAELHLQHAVDHDRRPQPVLEQRRAVHAVHLRGGRLHRDPARRARLIRRRLRLRRHPLHRAALRLGPITASVYANVFNLLNTQRPLTRQANHDLETFATR